jgi:hypothetical protein
MNSVKMHVLSGRLALLMAGVMMATYKGLSHVSPRPEQFSAQGPPWLGVSLFLGVGVGAFLVLLISGYRRLGYTSATPITIPNRQQG